jgi:hypothetical protein
MPLLSVVRRIANPPQSTFTNQPTTTTSSSSHSLYSKEMLAFQVPLPVISNSTDNWQCYDPPVCHSIHSLRWTSNRQEWISITYHQELTVNVNTSDTVTQMDTHGFCHNHERVRTRHASTRFSQEPGDGSGSQTSLVTLWDSRRWWTWSFICCCMIVLPSAAYYYLELDTLRGPLELSKSGSETVTSSLCLRIDLYCCFECKVLHQANLKLPPKLRNCKNRDRTSA